MPDGSTSPVSLDAFRLRRARWRVVEDHRTAFPYKVQKRGVLGWRTQYEHSYPREAIDQCIRLASMPRVIHEEE